MNEKAEAGKGEAVHVETGSGTGIEDFAALIEPGTHLDAKAEKRMYRKVSPSWPGLSCARHGSARAAIAVFVGTADVFASRKEPS